MKRLFAAAGLAALLAAAVVPAAAFAPSPQITAAVADAGRPDADKAKDESRKPADIIAFIGVKPGQMVMDVWPGSGYWSRLFSRVVGPKGKVYAYVPAEIVEFKTKPFDIAKAMAAEPGNQGNVEAISDPAASQPPPNFQNKLDAVWIFENYHDLYNPFMKGADVAGFNKAVFGLLKPGGVYVIGDHAAPAGSGLTATNTTHRIDPDTVKAEVMKAGFKFVGETRVLANPDDPHTDSVFKDPIKGHTDRFVFKFVKPR